MQVNVFLAEWIVLNLSKCSQLEDQPIAPLDPSECLPNNVRLPGTSSSKVHALVLFVPVRMSARALKHWLIPSPVLCNFSNCKAFMQSLLCFFENLSRCIGGQEHLAETWADGILGSRWSRSTKCTLRSLSSSFGSYGSYGIPKPTNLVCILLRILRSRSSQRRRKAVDLAFKLGDQRAVLTELIGFAKKLAFLNSGLDK